MIRKRKGWFVPLGDGFSAEVHPIVAQWPFAAEQINRALAWAKSPGERFVVQAGARVGLWPKVLRERGCCVLAFEPDAENFECCRQNLAGLDHIDVRHAALGATCTRARLRRSPYSSGEYYLDTDGEQDVEVVTVDSLALARCDALFLDVEGYELRALQGAERTLQAHRPVVVAEENGLCERIGSHPGDIAAYLRAYGYELVDEYYTLPEAVQKDGAFHGSDLIFAIRR